MPTVVIRADASVDTGTGHVMRCLALAQALREAGFHSEFAAVRSTGSIDARLAEEGFLRHQLPGPSGSPDDLSATIALLNSCRAAAVVVDGYEFPARYRAGLRAAARCVLTWDDTADLEALHADVVVNPAPGADPAVYGRLAPGARLLLGPAYAALRQDVRKAARAPRLPLKERDLLLVTFGGSDPLGLTGPCLELLAAGRPARCRVVAVVGGSNPRAAQLMDMTERLGGSAVEVATDVKDMGALMARAGLAVSAAGGTTAELAALAVPTLLAVVARNQAIAAESSGLLEWCEVVDARMADAAATIAQRALALWNDPETRQRMADRANGLVDGDGAPRIALALAEAVAARSSSDLRNVMD